MKTVCSAIVLLICFAVTAQTTGVKTAKHDTISWPGGIRFSTSIDSLYKHINTNLKYPQVSKDCGCGGLVGIEFTVDAEGNIINPKPTYHRKNGCPDETVHPPCKGAYKLLTEEALRLFKTAPKLDVTGWKVPVTLNLPIEFKPQ